MNEQLCRALVAAGLSEEDVAARLDVDPKTVRRWAEGRLPYRRYRRALALLLGVDDADLWPGQRGRRGRPGEVVAIYPHRDLVPDQVWLRLLGSATRQIGILALDGTFLAQIPRVLDMLGQRAEAGARARICVGEPGQPGAGSGTGADDGGRGVPGLYGPLRSRGDVQIRLHHGDLHNDICFADDRLIVVQRAYAVPDGRCPVLQLERSHDADLFMTYLVSFERTWSRARPD